MTATVGSGFTAYPALPKVMPARVWPNGLTDANGPDPSLPWPAAIGEGWMFLADWEQAPGGGVALKAYLCPSRVWTCGWGETSGVTSATRWTKQQGDAQFCVAVTTRTARVLAKLTSGATEEELSALVSLEYNIGTAAFAKSTVLRLHNAGNKAGAARAFLLWNKFTENGVLKVSKGLTRRRHAEAALYMTQTGQIAAMPQAVEAQPALSASPTMLMSTGIAGATVLQGLSESVSTVTTVGATIKTARESVTDLLPVPAHWALPALVVILAGVVAYRRWRQRANGVA